MLINLSNHPSKDWAPEQRERAEQLWRSVVDLPFPIISPEQTTDEVVAMAVEYLQRCFALFDTSADEPRAVHLMGEMTFTYNLVEMLKSNDITVVASTTERIVTIENDVKRSIFKFVTFREY